ncbi:MAG: universal stress protein [Rubrivivax sp.]|nr:universal stress protein [Rubrivivax sp.]
MPTLPTLPSPDPGAEASARPLAAPAAAAAAAVAAQRALAPAPPPPLDLQPGMVLEGFRLEQALHTGGFAHIWSVTRTDGDHSLPLVMKVPRYLGGREPAAIVGFEAERLILPTLIGPHVPRFVASSGFSSQPFIVMERIAGDSLKPRLDAAPLPIAEVTELGACTAEALDALHRQRVVHLDVKPSNVMRRPDGTAVMVDFGLACHRRLPDLLDEAFVLPLGTGPYMSPEQVQQVRSDPRSDLFALGVMLYHFTTGARPFGAPDTVRGLRRRLYVEAVPPRSLRLDCPPWLQEVILRCLEVDAGRRWQSGAELAEALRRPERIALTARADRSQGESRLTRLRRWIGQRQPVAAAAPPAPSVLTRAMKGPLIVAAVDVDNASPALLDRLRQAVARTVAAEPGARLACVSVMRVGGIRVDEFIDQQGRPTHVKQLVSLRHWAEPIGRALALDERRLTYHVLEAADAATALVEYAQRNDAEHLVMGARGSSTLRRYLGSVSSQVVAQANCSVTVVRV